ncbi:MAG: EscU/YscU/HrcU family type III secretion system export apparatus switch protein, partial [Synergistaceae bacterium]|nr:EscU/YscU/HrcU family type III secretion system export apparatus switch protein [Synergistaceae bacterium]
MSGKFFFDIQFFAEERTEPATPRKRDKERKKGHVAKSQDLSAAVVLISGLLTLYALGLIILRRLALMFKVMASHLSSPQMDGDAWWAKPLAEAAGTYSIVWLPIGVISALFALAIMIYQVGLEISAEPFELKFDRLNPINGLKKIMSIRTLVELCKGILKALVLFGILYLALRDERDLLLSIMMFPLEKGSGILMGRMWNLAMRMAVILFIIALADYAYQKWEFEKSIKMSKHEIKEEFKQMEGDPQVKRRIRQKQREMAQRRMMADVPKSDVVVTNPTRIAVAIQYDQQSMNAPIVVAKGEDFIAQKIRDIAAEHNIPIVEN